MLGAGVLVGPAPAAAASGGWFLLGIPIAALMAACSAFATAEQSAVYRGPGAAYAATRATLGAVPARILASADLAGHVAAMAAVAGAIARYAAPGFLPASAASGVAAVTILVVVLASTAGLRIRGLAAWLWLGLTLAVLAIVVTACFAIPPASLPAMDMPRGNDATGIVGAAGVMVFALLGFERLTAPGEERDRAGGKVLRRGVVTSLVVAAGITLLVGAALLYQLGAARLALSPAPVLDALTAASAANLAPLVGTGAALAMLPVLLGIVESCRSTALTVVRESRLLPTLGRTGKNGTPVKLDLCAAIPAVVLGFLLEPAQTIALAACCMLVRLAFVNASARVLLDGGRTWLLRTLCLGAGLAVILAMSMPVLAILETLAVVVAGTLGAAVISGRRVASRSESQDEQ